MALKFQMSVKTLANNVVSINIGRQRIKWHKKIPINQPGMTGYSTVPDGHLSAEVAIEINVNKLEEFVHKSIANSGGICREAKGALVIRAIHKKHEPPESPPAQLVGA